MNHVRAKYFLFTYSSLGDYSYQGEFDKAEDVAKYIVCNPYIDIKKVVLLAGGEYEVCLNEEEDSICIDFPKCNEHFKFKIEDFK